MIKEKNVYTLKIHLSVWVIVFAKSDGSNFVRWHFLCFTILKSKYVPNKFTED